MVTFFSQAELKKARAAFTLMELLVVVAILATLTALLLPALSRSKAYAHTTTCKYHLHQMGLALGMYAHDNLNRYPYYLDFSDLEQHSAAAPDNTGFWSAKLFPYYQVSWMDPAYHCPGYKGAITGRLDHHDPLGSYAYNEYGVASFAAGYTLSNGFHSNFPPATLGLQSSTTKRPPISAASIVAPSQMCAMGESRFFSAPVNESFGGVDFLQSGWLHWDASDPGDGSRREWAFNPARHGKNYNLLFCDAHVEAMNPSVWFNPTNSASLWNNDHQPHPEMWLPN